MNEIYLDDINDKAEDYAKEMNRARIEQTENEKSRELEQQEIDVRKQELAVSQQQQDTNHLLVVGGLAIGGALVLVIAILLAYKVFRRR